MLLFILPDIYHPALDVSYNHAFGIAMAFNRGIITDLLKKDIGFSGYVKRYRDYPGAAMWA